MRRSHYVILTVLVFLNAASAMQGQGPAPHGWHTLTLATLAHWATLWVFYNSMLVNFLAGIELILKTFEDWANDNMFGNFATKVKRVEFYVAAVTDLVDRIGAINFKDKIRPTRRDKRASDPSPTTVENRDTAARAAGIGS